MGMCTHVSGGDELEWSLSSLTRGPAFKLGCGMMMYIAVPEPEVEGLGSKRANGFKWVYSSTNVICGVNWSVATNTARPQTRSALHFIRSPSRTPQNRRIASSLHPRASAKANIDMATEDEALLARGFTRYTSREFQKVDGVLTLEWVQGLLAQQDTSSVITAGAMVSKDSKLPVDHMVRRCKTTDFIDIINLGLASLTLKPVLRSFDGQKTYSASLQVHVREYVSCRRVAIYSQFILTSTMLFSLPASSQEDSSDWTASRRSEGCASDVCDDGWQWLLICVKGIAEAV